jgi:signal peptidase I
MRLNLSDEPATAELLAEALRRAGGAVITVNGNSMHPTLQMGWRIHLGPVPAGGLRIGDLGVFRGSRHLTIHRLIWKETGRAGETLVFRGDYNRLRERVAPRDVIAQVVAVEVPGQRRGMERTLAVRPDALTWFYRTAYGLSAPARPLFRFARRGAGAPPGPLGRAARALFAAAERLVSTLLRDRR